MARLYRLHPDSSYLTAPRVFARVFCDMGALAATVGFYEALMSVNMDMDMDIPEAGLHVVAVGPFLILEMDKEKLDRAGQAAQTRVTVLNASLDEAVARAVAAGAEVVQQRWEAPPGPGMRLRHPDGLLAEYLEHRPSPDDVDEPGPDFSVRGR
jgi:predicted enzyme related to lactoylglutathione lyase